MTRPLGPFVDDWTDAADPSGLRLRGQFAALAPLDVGVDAPALWPQFAGQDWVWDYLFEVPPTDAAVFQGYLERVAGLEGQPCYVISDIARDVPLGYACFWTVVRPTGVIEIGNVNLSPALQRTPIATEAFFLMIDWAFANGYRRMEWKCNALNAPSRRAAQRLGFSYEGVFRNHTIVKGRSRDTAWFAITDADWPALRAAYATWLALANFDDAGQQHHALAHLTAPCLFQRDPTQASG